LPATTTTFLRFAACFARAAEAAVAVGAGADFLALNKVLSSSELAALTDSVPVPVYVLEIELGQAWALGASGLNEICR
jgi:2-methylisocitrate lyase-like PEP mutase family enzyme